jgi:hypothetical protein
MGKQPGVPSIDVSMCITHRHPPTEDDLTHLVVKLENDLNSNPPRKINASFVFERSLTKFFAL